MFEISELEVDALVFESLEVAKLEELPNSVVMFAEMIVASEVIRLVKFALVENRLVDEELVLVPLSEIKFFEDILPAERVVIVALVSVAFPA